MKEEIFETVLNEILEELRQYNQSVKSICDTINAVRDSPPDQASTPAPDIRPFQESLELGLASLRQEISAGIAKVNAIAEAQPKSVIRQFRLSLFPENDWNGHYKFFISRLFLSIIALVLIAGLFSLFSQCRQDAHTTPASYPTPEPAQTASPPPPPDRPIPPRRHPGRSKKNSLDTLNKNNIHEISDSVSKIHS